LITAVARAYGLSDPVVWHIERRGQPLDRCDGAFAPPGFEVGEETLSNFDLGGEIGLR
jgi:hypothetical protein